MKLSLIKFTNRPHNFIRQLQWTRPVGLRVSRFRPVASGKTPSPSSENLVHDAIKRIDKYCTNLPQDSVVSERCWEAREYFTREALDAERRCNLELNSCTKSTGEGCKDFEDWEKFVRQVNGAGGVREMVRSILVIKNAKQHEHDSHQSSIVPVQNANKIRVRELCELLFDRMDKNHDGRIDVEEFRALMKLIGDELDGGTVSIIFDALDIQGSLDFDQLITVIEAEAIRSRSKTADWLRLAQRHGHTSDTPKWI
eukprot:g6152.t1